MNFKMEFFLDAVNGAVSGLPVSLAISALTLLIGLFFGTIIALCRVFHVKVLSQVFTVLTAIIKSIPANLIIILINLVFTTYFNTWMQTLGISLQVKDVDKIWIGVFSLSITAIASISESVRGALLSVPADQYEAGYSVGLTGFQTFMRIIVPQTVIALLPNLINNIVGLIKMTSLVMLVGITDMLNSAIIRASITFGYLEAYFAVSIFYWALSIVVEQIGKRLEKRSNRFRSGTVAA